jgi:hypothetical protein
MKIMSPNDYVFLKVSILVSFYQTVSAKFCGDSQPVATAVSRSASILCSDRLTAAQLSSLSCLKTVFFYLLNGNPFGVVKNWSTKELRPQEKNAARQVLSSQRNVKVSKLCSEGMLQLQPPMHAATYNRFNSLLLLRVWYKECLIQGCPIFHGSWYQNQENVPNM